MKRFDRTSKNTGLKKYILTPVLIAYLLFFAFSQLTSPTSALFNDTETIDGKLSADQSFGEEEESEDKDHEDGSQQAEIGNTEKKDGQVNEDQDEMDVEMEEDQGNESDSQDEDTEKDEGENEDVEDSSSESNQSDQDAKSDSEKETTESDTDEE